jgi:hypothetical protein
MAQTNTHTNTAVRVGGMWLAVASFLMIAVLVFHGPIAPDLNDQMTRIADAALRWSMVHWVAAAALSLYAVSGLVVLTSQSRLTDGQWRMTAWAVLVIGALWTMTTAVVEATVVTNTAVSGSNAIFETWWAFAEGKATGFAILALAVAVIAGNEARSSEGVTPKWSAWAAMAAGVVSFAGWALGMWFGVGIGNLLWVVSSILMNVWTFWLGVVLMRSRANIHLKDGTR